jgi:predicted  nucleic acid-binding Zn-ribbon protein
VWLVSIFVVWLNGVSKRRALKKENESLKNHLHNQMEINAKGAETQNKDIEKLKKRNENLQTTLATLKAKTSTEEKRMLMLYDKAIHLMYEKAPGFAASWEMILKDAQDELDKADDGSEKVTKKIIRPSLLNKAKTFITNVTDK